VPVERAHDDLYQDNGFPNYHFVEFTLNDDGVEGRMYPLSDPTASAPSWELKDRFQNSNK
jgi:hypothetical protein